MTMKKLIFGLLACLVLFTAQAQEEPARALKKAGSALKAFQLDPTGNLDKLHESVDMISITMAADEFSNSVAALQAQGDIFNALANQIVNIRYTNIGSLEELPQAENPALKSLMGYQKALSLAEKKFQIKDALKGIRAVQANLNNLGIYAYEDGGFSEAYHNFNGVLTAHELLSGANEESMLDAEETLNEQLYITGLAALNANELSSAAPLFSRLKEAGTDKPAIYEALYKIEAADALDPETTLDKDGQNALLEKAYANLAEGRERYPDDISILFAEINHFLRINKLDVLITKLEAALEKEPDNITLYTTMGNVYDNLYQIEAGEEGNPEKAAEYFDSSLSYYEQALAKDPSFTDATYSIGALYFNRAAKLTEGLTAMADDFSKEGQRKYEVLQGEVEAEFSKALPYFIEVEKKKPADVNTLIALKEIYARKNDFTMSNEFKARYESVTAGEELESYFMKN